MLTPKSFILSMFGVVAIRWGLLFITFLNEEAGSFRPVSTLAVTSGGFFVLMCAIVLALVVVLLAMLLAVLRFDALRTGRNDARPLSVTTGSRSGINCSVNTFGGGSTSSVVASAPVSLVGTPSTGLAAADVDVSAAHELSLVVLLAMVGAVAETDGVEISAAPTRVAVEDDDEMVLLFERVCSPKPESDVEALFSSLDSESFFIGGHSLLGVLLLSISSVVDFSPSGEIVTISSLLEPGLLSSAAFFSISSS